MTPATISYEHRDKNILMEKVMDFGPSRYEEVASGNMVASCEYHRNEGIVNFVSIASYDGLAISLSSNIVSTSVKAASTYEDPGSDRQVVVELLATSQVLRASGKKAKFVIALKATATRFQPYFYFPPNDLLLRVINNITFEADMAGRIRKCYDGQLHFLFVTAPCSKPYDS